MYNESDYTVALKYIDYCPLSGELFWKNKISKYSNIKIGNRAGFKRNGYIKINILGLQLYAHRIAYYKMFGILPEQIDHIDGNRTNNKIHNIRKANNLINSKNKRIISTNTSGYMGVGRYKNKWRARIKVNNKEIHLGIFSNYDDAVSVRIIAENKYGFHKNHGRLK